MKKSRFTEEQIAFALKQAETGTPVAEVLRRMGISEQTFYRWKKLYGGLGTGELRRLKQLEDENRKLKQLVAGLKAAFSGQSLIGTGILSSSNKPVKIGQTTKISVTSRADYKTKLSKGRISNSFYLNPVFLTKIFGL